MTIDTNAATGGDSLIPEGAIVALKLALRPGFGTQIHDATPSKSGPAVYADYEGTTIAPAEYKGRKFWQRCGLIDKEGKTLAQGGNFYVQKGAYELRKMVESAKSIAHDDMSSAAVEARKIKLNDLHGAVILVTVKHETDNRGVDRQVIDGILTPSDYPEYVDARKRFGLADGDSLNDIA